MLDEVGFAVKSLTITPSRTKKTYKGASGATFALRFIDPLITFSFTGMRAPFAPPAGTPPVDAQNIGWKHPGTGVDSLLNFAAEYRGYDPTLGVLIYEEPEDTFNGEDPAETTFDVVQYPFVEAGSYVEI